MRDWASSGRRWACTCCLDILDYHEIYQAEGTSPILCGECARLLNGHRGVEPVRFNEIPLLCDECGNGLIPLESIALDGWGPDGKFCQVCAGEYERIDIDGTIEGLLSILGDTDEEG